MGKEHAQCPNLPLHLMQPPVLHKIKNQTLWLSPLRAIFWEEERALILSDLHFGKTGHFRKAGIAVPQAIYKEDMQRLVNLLQYFQPRQIIAVGDLFHSKANQELEWFKRWRGDFAAHFHLVRGNHDILHDEWYKEADIEVWDDDLIINNFCFTHEHCQGKKAIYTFCGHLHPGIVIHGLARQSLRFPCFYFAKDHCILPAYSKFTGLAIVESSKAESVFAVVENSLIRM
ncbi:ligase-associated DNA damage response endonuclease PdeM [Chitinophagaceae bacterium LB-8]|uniref:Ligase-associated DNA damage response endonuclease PdeM n=1 Tax=Paraflavisolibacter caeni TaxID=2982496 RepID=A0A9X3BGU0_9BACT|nr:ligase-associated DNA damage response endonuclease PdeM [Paraflavisolibacter caeni]MCU7548362.1 ligase-associated DNA damage response endonuclease PdeM [Paraflavisolibacter caeni]